MDDKLKMQRALLDHLEKESEKIQSLMDELLKSMDTIPSDQRHGPAWEANTKRFLELVERSGDVARKLQLGSDKKGRNRKETVLSGRHVPIAQLGPGLSRAGMAGTGA
jgi:hypothetical protein